MKRYKFKGLPIIGLLFILFGLNQFSKYPNNVMIYYSNGVYLKIKFILGSVANKMPMAYGEVLVGILLIWGISLLWYRWWILVKHIRVSDFKTVGRAFFKEGYRLIVALLVVLVVFQSLWGLNYHQLSLLQQLELERQPVNVDVLTQLLTEEITEMSALRSMLKTSSKNVVVTDLNIYDLMNQSMRDYKHASELYAFIDQPSSTPKPIVASLVFSYSGVSGIFNPFTGEANVNRLNSPYLLPAVAAHELAHQQGIAREDEANFIAYIVTSSSPSYFSQYSGRLLMLIYGLNNLREIDPIVHKGLYDGLPMGIKNDIYAHNLLWQQYEGPLDDLQNTMNDEYLKANGLENGIGSYSEVIDLYVAWSTKK